ncbi:MAG: DNA primase, partial [Peptoniphilaceae bacterium]
MTYIINDNLLDDIRERADIVDVISEYISLKKSGSNYIGLCPFHNEKTPSFTVSPSKGIFHCFGCGVGGDQISFIMKRENLGFKEAVKFLADKYNIKVNEYNNPRDNKIKEKKERAYKANREAALFFYNNLKKNKQAYNYLLKRDIKNDVINTYGLGYANNSWDSLYKYLISKGYKGEELEEFNLVYKSKKGNFIDRFRNRIMFPIINSRRKVIGFGGRVLDDSLPKYLNTRDTIIFNKGENLYNINIISEKTNRDKIILVEGYMDVISLYKSGINYSVASLGTALTLKQASLLDRYANEVYICYDSDEAGIKATDRAIDILISKNISPKIIMLPENLDPDDYLKKYGKLSFELEISKALPYLDYKILKIKNNYNLDSAQGLSGFANEVAAILQRVKNPLERDIYLSKISREYNISKDAINSYIVILERSNKKKYFKKNNFKNIENNPNQRLKAEDGRQKAENQLIKYAILDLENFTRIREKLNSYEFLNINARIIFDELLEFENSSEQRYKEFLKHL